MKLHAGSYTRKTLPQNHGPGKGVGLNTTHFYKYWSTESEVSEAQAITRVVSGGLSGVPVGKEGGDPGVDSVV